ncbi:MAG: hypothetical protein PHT78_06405 [Desulfitobacteriaceae bacterium]|nr:hypothetical protein [Desulfitobacteriaceae bacterium]MDD4752868.1 hypothetical protein [Desulfitobacteriaceae bacterium]
MNAVKNSPAKRTAYGGVLAACALIFLFLATILPTNRIFFYGLSSVFIAVMILEYGTTAGWMFYVVTSLLALIIIPHKLRLIPYILVLGHYGVFKTLIERLHNRFFEAILKLVVLNIGFLLAYLTVTTLFKINIKFPFHPAFIIIAVQPLFLVYDFVFTLCIRFYLDRIKPNIKN